MHTLITVFHISVAIFLILVVLLQSGKGASMGAAFGGAGSSQTMFGSSGAGSFLTKLTTGAAIIFMITSFSLATISNKGDQGSVIDEIEETTQLNPSQDPPAKQD